MIRHFAASNYPYLTSEASKTFLVENEKDLHKNLGQKGLNFSYNDINDKPASFSDLKVNMLMLIYGQPDVVRAKQKF